MCNSWFRHSVDNQSTYQLALLVLWYSSMGPKHNMLFPSFQFLSNFLSVQIKLSSLKISRLVLGRIDPICINVGQFKYSFVYIQICPTVLASFWVTYSFESLTQEQG